MVHSTTGGFKFPDGTTQTTAANGGGAGNGHSLDAADGNPTDVVYVNNDGNVGIGTTNPQRILHMAKPDHATLVLEDTGASADEKKKFVNVDDGYLRFGKFSDSWTYTPQLSIDSGGNVGIGTPYCDYYKLEVLSQQRGAGAFTIYDAPTNNSNALYAYTNGTGNAFLANHSGSSGNIAVFQSEFENKVVIDNDGNVGIGTTAAGNILAVQQSSTTDPIADAWTVYSSRRWKTNIGLIEGAIDKIQRLRGVSFEWKANGKHDIGLIAEEVGEIIPEVVVYEENGTDAKSVDYARLVAVLIEAVKEQQRQLDELRKIVQLQNE